jgi:Yip1 domain
MSETLPPPTLSPTPVQPENPGGFFQNLIDVYFAPREAFTRVVRSPRVLVPLVVYVVLVLGFTGVWMQKMDAREFMKTQIEESGRADKIPADQREAIIEQQARFMPIYAWVLGPVGIAVTLLVIAGALLFIFRFFYSSEVVFKQAFAIVTWTFFAVGLVTTPLLLLVLQMKGDWNINPQEAIQANLGLLLDRSAAAKPLWALLSSIDVFSLWMIFLLAVGFGVASKKTTGSALWGVAIPWGVFVLCKVGWAALF